MCGLRPPTPVSHHFQMISKIYLFVSVFWEFFLLCTATTKKLVRMVLGNNPEIYLYICSRKKKTDVLSHNSSHNDPNSWTNCMILISWNRQFSLEFVFFLFDTHFKLVMNTDFSEIVFRIVLNGWFRYFNWISLSKCQTQKAKITWIMKPWTI